MQRGINTQNGMGGNQQSWERVKKQTTRNYRERDGVKEHM